MTMQNFPSSDKKHFPPRALFFFLNNFNQLTFSEFATFFSGCLHFCKVLSDFLWEELFNTNDCRKHLFIITQTYTGTMLKQEQHAKMYLRTIIPKCC